MNIKCNICGGEIALDADKTFGTCEYCGSTVTLPKVTDEQRAAAFNRGNHFRRMGEFDKALASYERILREDDTGAEAHWCAALCRFGIEYVEDPATYEWIPTCHRASFDSFTEDVDYRAALEHSDGLTRRLYQKEAVKIAEVQKGILAASRNEEPYDVFICYKETDAAGQRTRDSILAQDIYYQLTDQGHRVFFSRITLEDKAGSEYEPYIFAALNSAKVMVAVGTKPEHFPAVWVKNEWSRFLALMRKDRSRVLLPFRHGLVFGFSYLFLLIAFGVSAAAMLLAFRGGSGMASRYYGIPIARVGVMYLAIQGVLTLVFMALGRPTCSWSATASAS